MRHLGYPEARVYPPSSSYLQHNIRFFTIEVVHVSHHRAWLVASFLSVAKLMYYWVISNHNFLYVFGARDRVKWVMSSDSQNVHLPNQSCLM